MKIMAKKILKWMGFELKRLQHFKFDKGQIVFIHIGKNAGTQIMYIANKLTKYGVHIKKYGHNIKLSNLPLNTKYFFSIRKPETRFASGFYSRKRKGQPRLYNEWNLHESLAFDAFEHANDLAENLFSEDTKGRFARQAIKSISHTARQQFDWFQDCAFLDKQSPITIIRQEYFEKDMQRLLDLLGLDLDIKTLTTKDKVNSHSYDYSKTPPLSDLAVANLKKWYVQDYWFYEMCEVWLNKSAESN